MAHTHRDRTLTAVPPPLVLDAAVYDVIRRTIGARHAEQGGMLGGPAAGNTVTHFHFDRAARRSGATYSPDTATINAVLEADWNPAEIRLRGFVHSHPPGCRQPSAGDRRYARAILAAVPDLPRLYLPIVMTEPDTGRFELLAYAAVRDGDDVRITPVDLLVEQPATTATPPTVDLGTTFDRVRDAYDLDRLALCRVICVGVGGAAAFAEDLARAGVGAQVLIDPDVVSETNLATQQVYRADIGRPKVDCVGERLLDINPGADIVPVPAALDDLTDAALADLAFAPIHGEMPRAVLLCGLTDNFFAQARVNRLGLNLGVPTLCAQVYREGRGAEVTFTYPGVTTACQRCVLSSRYAHYLEGGFQNDVTSHGTPICATTRLNALKAFIALALLHHGMLPAGERGRQVSDGAAGEHPAYQRWGTLLARIGTRNLVQIRMDPDLGQTLGLGVFDRVFTGADGARLLTDEVVWLPQDPDREDLNGRPTCPECGGTGDLRDVHGRFSDTRVMSC